MLQRYSTGPRSAWMSSSPIEGTRAASESPGSPPPRGLPGQGRVLVVEDDDGIRETLEVLVTIEGCEVRTVSDGARALEIVEDWVPDLILLDLSLPVLSGEEFIAAYHGRPTPHAPIIVMTGWDLSR